MSEKRKWGRCPLGLVSIKAFFLRPVDFMNCLQWERCIFKLCYVLYSPLGTRLHSSLSLFTQPSNHSVGGAGQIPQLLECGCFSSQTKRWLSPGCFRAHKILSVLPPYVLYLPFHPEHGPVEVCPHFYIQYLLITQTTCKIRYLKHIATLNGTFKDLSWTNAASLKRSHLKILWHSH